MELQSDKKILGIVPAWAITPIIFDILTHWGAYYGGSLLAKLLYGVILKADYFNFTLPVDALVPIQPLWSIFYYPCFILWALTYIWLPNHDKKGFYRFITAECIANIITMVFFVFLPTTMTRADLPVTDIGTFCLKSIYIVDAPVNLFPSMHVLIAWLVYRGVAFKKCIPLWIRITQLISFFATCYCILTIRQHVIVDIFGGVAVAEIGWFVSKRVSAQPTTDKIAVKVNIIINKILSKKSAE